MSNFFDDTANDQHDPAHDFPEHDVDSNDGNKTNSKSNHGKRNQHKQNKESNDMNQMIKNNIAPVLAAFAVATLLIFGIALDGQAADKNKFDNFDNQDVFACERFSTDCQDRGVCADRKIFLDANDFRSDDNIRDGVVYVDQDQNKIDDPDQKFVNDDVDYIVDNDQDYFVDAGDDQFVQDDTDKFVADDNLKSNFEEQDRDRYDGDRCDSSDQDLFTFSDKLDDDADGRFIEVDFKA